MDLAQTSPWEPEFALGDWTTDLRRQHFNLWHSTLAPAWAATGKEPAIIVSVLRDGRFAAVNRAAATDADVLWRIISNGCRGASGVYAGINPTPAARAKELLASKQRGSATDLAGVTCIVADLDFAEAAHKGRVTPAEQAWETVHASPLGVPTLVVGTGGGLHAYWVLSEPMAVAEAKPYMDRFAVWVKAHGGDSGITRDPARVLRVPGTSNGKTVPAKPCWVIEANNERRIDPADLNRLLPAPVKPESPAPAAKERAPRAAKGGAVADAVARFNASEESLVALVQAAGMHSDGGDGWAFDDSEGVPCHLYRDIDDDGAETPRLHVFGSRRLAEWGLDDNAGNLRASDLLTVAFCGGDWRLAGRLIAEFDGTNVGALVEELENAGNPRTLSARWPSRAETSLGLGPVATTDPTADALVSDVALEQTHEIAGVEIRVEDDIEAAVASGGRAAVPCDPSTTEPDGDLDIRPLYAVVNDGRAVGLFEEQVKLVRDEQAEDEARVAYQAALLAHKAAERELRAAERTEKKESTEDTRAALADAKAELERNPKPGNLRSVMAPTRTFTRVANHIAWQRAMTRTFVCGPDGTPQEVSDPRISVTVLDPTGVKRTTAPLHALEARDPRKVLAAAGGALAVPPTLSGRALYESMLSTLGGTTRREEEEYACTGWLKRSDGTHVFLAPAGAVDASGPVDGYRSVAPVGSTGTIDQIGLGAVGWPRKLTADELRSAAAGIKEWFDVCAQNPPAAALAVAPMFAAPLTQTLRGVPYLDGSPGSGKSIMLRAANAFLTGSTAQTALPIEAANATAPGVLARARWARSTTVLLDNIRTENMTPQQISTLWNAVVALIGAGFGVAGTAKASQAGGIRADAPSYNTTAISGEHRPTDRATIDRCVFAHIERGDVNVTRGDDGLSPWDRWAQTYGDSGLMQGLYGDYLSFLASVADQHGLTWLTATADADRGALAAPFGAGRQVENPASLLVGWQWLYRWAEDRGVVDALPSWTSIEAWFRTLTDGSKQEHADGVASAKFPAGLADLFASRRIHLEVAQRDEQVRDGTKMTHLIPRSHYAAWGYPMGNAFPAAGSVSVGVVVNTAWDSDRSRYVLAITQEGMGRAWEMVYGRRYSRAVEVEEALRGLLMRPQAVRTPAALKLASRARVFLIRAAALGLDPTVDDDAEADCSTTGHEALA